MVQDRVRATFVGLTLVAVVIAGCGVSGTASQPPGSAPPSAPAATPSPPPTRPPSPTPAPSVRPSATPTLPRSGRIEVVRDGYAVTLAANWFRIELSKDEIAAFSKSGTSVINEQAGEALSNQIASIAASNISLFALRFADKKAVLGTNLNVLSLPTSGFDLDTIEDLNMGQFASLFGKDVVITNKHVTLPAGEAVRFSYTLKGSATTGSQTLSFIQHLVVAGDRQIFLTCTAPGSITAIATECDAIARSLEILGV
jgi:hypothetical protein